MADFIVPVDLPISSPYGPRGGGMHYGIDYSDGRDGHPIRAVADGTVIYNAHEPGGFGNTVTLLHDGIKSGYGHMREGSMHPVGAWVRQGDVIGFVGTTGASTGPHLHLWMGDDPNEGSVDPAPLLEPGEEPFMAALSDDEQRELYDLVRAMGSTGIHALGLPNLFEGQLDVADLVRAMASTGIDIFGLPNLFEGQHQILARLDAIEERLGVDTR